MMREEQWVGPWADRYRFDWGMCSVARGFAQVDTKQDASYYGTWANPETLTVMCFTEGDLTTVICETPEEFVEHVRKLAAWNDERGYGPMKIDPRMNKDIERRFVELGLGDLLY